MDLFGYFQTMIDPEERSPERVPDSHAAMSAVFKTPWIHDVGYSGRWNAVSVSTDPIDPNNPTDGYSEVIVAPGTTGGYFVTLGNDADIDIWDEKSEANSFLLLPTLSTHPNRSDLAFTGAGPELCQGFRFHSTDHTHIVPANLAWLPKKSAGSYKFECIMHNPGLAMLEFHLDAFATNLGSLAVTNTNLHLRWSWDSGAVGSQVVQVYSGSFLPSTFSFLPPYNGAFITSFSFHVHDQSMDSHWVVSLAPPSEFDCV
jgi:hypothetical protein